jgi:hypothetical protein
VTEDRARVKEVLSEIGFHKFRWDLHGKTTMVVDLEPSEEELLARMKGKTRYNIRLAARKGVAVVEDNSRRGSTRSGACSRRTSERKRFSGTGRAATSSPCGELCTRRAGCTVLRRARGRTAGGDARPHFGRKYYYIAGASIDEKRNLMPTTSCSGRS